MSSDILITMNIGSSSLRCGVFDLSGEQPVARRLFSIRGLPEKMIAETRDPQTGAADESVLDHPEGQVSHEAALDRTLLWLDDQVEAKRIVAFVHRIVHGGQNYSDPVLLDDTVLAELDALAPLAPSHQRHNLRPVHRLREMYPNALQIGCFDTAFHRTQPRLARLFALPRHLSDRGIVRYGFHGLSYAFIAGKLEMEFPQLADGRVIVAHLGHGVSMCAMQRGRSIATTMGLTALDGLPMGQRCGALDPGVVLHLIMDLGYDAAEVRDMLYNESGLLGVSGLSDDMGDLISHEMDHAREAVDLFVYRCGQMFGSLAATLGGVDCVVLTGGMGTHQPLIREKLAKELRWLGITFDAAANERGDVVLSDPTSAAPLLMIATDEEAVLAQNAATTLRS